MAGNVLYYGDNLDVLRRHVGDESVDLVYLDPPFKSDQDYNVLFAERPGAPAEAQIRAFEDTWRWDEAAARSFEETVESGGRVADALRAFRTLLGDSDMLAYIAMMAPRLVALRGVLKPMGSIYLHCDPTASHYLKLLLDAVFGPDHFLNEIIWKRHSAHSSAKRYGPVHDVLLFYRRGDTFTWTGPRLDYTQEYLDHYYRFDDGDGRLYWRNSLTAAGIRKGSSGQTWRGFDVAAQGAHWKFTIENLEALDAAGKIYWPPGGGWPQIKRYRDELKGVAVSDIWDDIDKINPAGNERLGFPTQKPEALLERIINASSREGDTILDPFCGCGTAVAVAQRLKRRWVGIDITHLAITLIRHRLQTGFVAPVEFSVIGEPVSVADAQALAEQDPYQFQWWALGLVGARPTEQKKGADKGIDGRLYFHEETGGDTKQIIFSVKAGNLIATYVRDLRGVIERERAQIGVLITMHEPTRQMRAEAASAGFYESGFVVAGGKGQRHARLQILTIAELLAGKRVDSPPIRQTSRTFKAAPRDQKTIGQQLELGAQPVAADKPAPYKKGQKRKR